MKSRALELLISLFYNGEAQQNNRIKQDLKKRLTDDETNMQGGADTEFHEWVWWRQLFGFVCENNSLKEF